MILIKTKYTRAFTLIEMSIVLLIIGLIAGSIVAGNFLTNQAKIRAVIAEIRDYKAAVNSFVIQFNALPGDLPNAASFWSTVSSTCTNSTSPVGCNGNNNGLIDWGVSSPVGQGAESLRAWQHLSLARLINGTFSGTTTIANQYDIGINVAASKFSPSGYYFSSEAWGGYSSLVKLYLTLGGFKSGSYNNAVSFLPTDLSDIDNKIDDGIGNTGNVLGAPTVSCISSGQYVLTNAKPVCIAGFSIQ